MLTTDSIILLGLAPFIGSFLGVLITRLPSGEPLIWSRSACGNCATPLTAPDLVPLFSWLLSRGRCRHCGAAVSTFYPLIELGAVTVALWAVVVTPGALKYASCALGWVLLALAMIDWRHMVLPDVLTLPLIPAGLGVAAWIDVGKVIDHAIGALVGFLLFAGLAWGYRRLRGRDGLGLGDAKLLAAGGAWVSWVGLGGIILIAAVGGLIVALAKGIRGKSPEPGDRLAFGPYLCLGIWVVWLHGPVVVGW